jgi:hypothetical protein
MSDECEAVVMADVYSQCYQWDGGTEEDHETQT